MSGIETKPVGRDVAIPPATTGQEEGSDESQAIQR